ncbi:MAG: hypothetical protein H7841_17565 [Magnetospirillum sp. WYHS-4]
MTRDIDVDFGSAGSGTVELRVPQTLRDLHLTSQGEELDYAVSEDGKTITGTAPDGRTIFTIGLEETGGAYSYRFHLEDTLDHPLGSGENRHDLPFEVVATTSAGQVLSDGFQVGVIDDVPKAYCDTDTVRSALGSITQGNVIDGLDLDNSPGAALVTDTEGADREAVLTAVRFGSETVSFDDPADVHVDDQGRQYLEIDGDHGRLHIYQDGSYAYQVTDPDLGDGLGDTTTIDINNYARGDLGFHLSARTFDAQGNYVDGQVNHYSGSWGTGFGVEGNKGGIAIGVDEETGYVPAYGKSEQLIVNFDDDVAQAQVTLDVFFNNTVDQRVEVGVITAYRDGQVVGTTTFAGQDRNGDLTVNLDFDAPFDRLVFEGMPYQGGQGGIASDSSDFLVRAITYTEIEPTELLDKFLYTIADYDGDTSTACLKVKLNDEDGIASTVAFMDRQEYEDSIVQPNVQTDVNADGTYGDLASGITVSVGDAIDLTGVTGDDAVTRIVLGDLPEGATLSLDGALLSAGTDGAFELAGSQLQTFLADQTSLVLTLPQHVDGDAALAVNVTVTDTSSGESQVFGGTVDVIVDAVADKPYNLDGAAALETGAGFDIPAMAHDISNIVLYLQDADGDFLKVKIDSFPGGERDPNNLDLDGFVADRYAGYEMVALTVKAGQNHPDGYGPGEGELFIVKPSLSEGDLPTADHADQTHLYGAVAAELTDGTFGEGASTVTIDVTAHFADFQDGSETHYILVEVPSGWSAPAGVELVNGSDLPEVTDGKTFARIQVDNATIAAGNGTATVAVELTPPAAVEVGTHTFQVYAEAYETSVSDTELTLANNRAFTPGVVELTITEPPTTEPPTTEPPTTEPATTEPPVQGATDFTLYTNQYGGYVGVDDVFFNAYTFGQDGEWTFVMPSANPGQNAYVWKANEAIPENPNTMFHNVNNYPVFEIQNKGANWHGQFDYTMQKADGTQDSATVDFNELEHGTVNGYKMLDITRLAGYDADETYNLAGCFQNDHIIGGGGDDIIFTGYGTYHDIADGGAGNDIIDGGDNNINTMYGGTGDDTIFAGGNTDTVYGGEGNDKIDAGTGNDTVYGDAGDDSIVGGDGSDKLYGGTGDDTVDAGTGSDSAWGGDGADVLRGGEGNDKLYGDAGGDTLYDDAGKDTVYGGTGDDTLVAGAGNDKLYGEDGSDVFVFGSGDGTDIASGGTGWTDTIHLEDVTGGPGGDAGWTLDVQGTVQITQTEDGLVFGSEASGTIRLDDGSELTFQGIEKIEW